VVSSGIVVTTCRGIFDTHHPHYRLECTVLFIAIFAVWCGVGMLVEGGGKRGALEKNLAKLAIALVYIHRIRNEPGAWNPNELTDIFSWPFLLAVAECDGGN